MCSVGGKLTEVKVRNLVAWIEEKRETESLSIDKAIFRMVSKSSGRNESVEDPMLSIVAMRLRLVSRSVAWSDIHSYPFSPDSRERASEYPFISISTRSLTNNEALPLPLFSY